MNNEVLITIVVAAFGSTGLWTVINNIIAGINERKKAKQKNPMQDMVLGTGYAILVYVCNQYVERGWVSPNEIRDLKKYLYDPYRELGGNGTAEMLFDMVKELPHEPEDI